MYKVKPKSDHKIWVRPEYSVYMSDQLFRKITGNPEGINKIYAENVKIVSNNIHSLLKVAKEHLKFPPHLMIRFAQIPGKGKGKQRVVSNGMWIEQYHTAVICPGKSVSQMVKSLFHELTHADQHQSQRLCYYRLDDGMMEMVWMFKEVFRVADSHEEYLSLPYEIEARTMADKLFHIAKRRRKTVPINFD